MTQSHLLHSLRDPFRLFPVQSQRSPRLDSAEAATASTDPTQDHERSCLMPPTLANVGATRLFTDRMQRFALHQPLQALIIFAFRSANLQPFRATLWNDGCHASVPLYIRKEDSHARIPPICL